MKYSQSAKVQSASLEILTKVDVLIEYYKYVYIYIYIYIYKYIDIYIERERYIYTFLDLLKMWHNLYS